MEFHDVWVIGVVATAALALLIVLYAKRRTAKKTEFARCPRCNGRLIRVPMLLLAECEHCRSTWRVEYK